MPTKVGHIRQTRQPRTSTLSNAMAENWNVVGVFNWEEIPSQVSLDLSDLGELLRQVEHAGRRAGRKGRS